MSNYLVMSIYLVLSNSINQYISISSISTFAYQMRSNVGGENIPHSVHSVKREKGMPDMQMVGVHNTGPQPARSFYWLLKL